MNVFNILSLLCSLLPLHIFFVIQLELQNSDVSYSAQIRVTTLMNLFVI